MLWLGFNQSIKISILIFCIVLERVNASWHYHPDDSTNRHGAIQPMLRCLSPDAVLDHKCMPLQYMGTYRDAGYSVVGVILTLGYIHYCIPIAMVTDTSMISL